MYISKHVFCCRNRTFLQQGALQPVSVGFNLYLLDSKSTQSFLQIPFLRRHRRWHQEITPYDSRRRNSFRCGKLCCRGLSIPIKSAQDPTLRPRIWKILLRVNNLSAETFLRYVARGPCEVREKIRNDTFRYIRYLVYLQFLILDAKDIGYGSRIQRTSPGGHAYSSAGRFCLAKPWYLRPVSHDI